MGQYSILIIDDEAITLDYLQVAIPRLDRDWSIAGVAHDGIEAMEYLDSHRVDLIITDIRMPEMTGLELCEYVRRQYPAQKIVILSGYEEFKLAQQAIQYGVLDYLLKPISLSQLKSTLEKIKVSLISEKASVGAQPVPEETEMASAPKYRKKHITGDSMIAQAERYIQEHYAEPISLAIIADRIDVSPNYLSALFHKELGESYSKYVTHLRMEHAMQLMRQYPAMKLNEIAARVGYVNVKHFSVAFRNYVGMTPGQFQARQNS